MERLTSGPQRRACGLELTDVMLVSGYHLLLIVALSLMGCAANKGLTGARSGGAMPKRCFWPPPQSTSLWSAETDQPLHGRTLAQVGDRLAALLREQGYIEQRWFPIGADFEHGFAVSTRLEQFDSRGTTSEAERWVAGHKEAASLFWLAQATSVRLPRPAQYRVLLTAFTDLPIGPTQRAPIWGRDTIMAGPDVPETLSAADLPEGRALESGRLGVYVYVYEKHPGDDEGRLLSPNALR